MEQGPVPRRALSKVALIVISIGVVMGLLVLLCVIARDVFDTAICPLVQENCD